MSSSGTTARPGTASFSMYGASVTKVQCGVVRASCVNTMRSSCSMKVACGSARSTSPLQKPMPVRMRKVLPSSSASGTDAREASGWLGGSVTERLSRMSLRLRRSGLVGRSQTMPRSKVPSSTPRTTAVSSTVSEVSVSRGNASTMRLVRRQSGAGATVPTRRARARRAAASIASRMSRSSRRICRAHSTAARPASLSVTPLPAREKSDVPRSASSRWMERLSAGCEMCSARAAADIVPSRVMASSWRSCSSSMGTVLLA